jgi:PAS domain S-box-containing protein
MQAEQDLQRHLARLHALHEIDQAITSTLELGPQLEVILREIRGIIRCDAISLQILDGDALKIAACLGFERPETVLGLALPLDPGFPHHKVVRERAAITLADAPQDYPRFRDESEHFSSRLIRSWLGVPLIVGDTPIGMISIDRHVVDPFSAEEIEIAGAFATQAAIAIRNAQLYRHRMDSDANYRSIFEGVQDAILVEGLDGAILDVNQRACDMYAYSRERLLQLHVTDLVAPGARQVRPEQISAAHGSDQVFETENVRASGERFPVQLTARLQTVGGRQVQLVVVRDVSEIHQARRRAELQDRLASVGQMAAGIAHDFNNILGTILLYGELISKEPGEPARIQERVHTIIEQADRGSRLIQQILDFSRRSVMEAHTMEIEPFLEDLRSLLARTLRENVRIRLQMDRAHHLKLHADPSRLQQILMNLALNAHQAMSEGGELTISASRIEVEPGRPPMLEMEAGPWIQLQVADTGEGIAPEHLPHIFEPFFTTRQPGEGTGLGLAQVYGLVKQHSGYIDVESRLGRGTTFTLYFPALPEEAEVTRVREQPQDVVGSGETVLVVEDDDVLQQALAETLESLNFRTLSARNGEEALRLFQREPGKIKFVLSDLIMPQLGGRKLLEELKRLNPDVKMIFMTGYPIREQTRELFDLHQVTWVKKPFTVREISQAISRVFR